MKVPRIGFLYPGPQQAAAARLEAAPFDADPLNFLHVPVATISLVVVIVAVVWRRRLHVASETTALSASVLLALVLNAAICGVFSHPDDRYQSRLIPLATLATAVLLLRARKKSKFVRLSATKADRILPYEIDV